MLIRPVDSRQADILGASIRWGHPITQGMQFLWLASEGQPLFDMVQGRRGSLISGSISGGGGAFGGQRGSNPRYSFAGRPTANLEPVVLFGVWRVATVANDWRPVISTSLNDTNYWVLWATNGNHASQSEISSRSTLCVLASTAPEQNVWYSQIGIVRASNQHSMVLKNWRTGVVEFYTESHSVTAPGDASPVAVGQADASSAIRTFDGDIAMAGISNGNLTDALLVDWALNPFGFLDKLPMSRLWAGLAPPHNGPEIVPGTYMRRAA